MPEEKIITAEKLAEEFKEHSVAEFFKKNRQMLGLYGKVRTLTTIVHEYVTNSLDACEEARILPEIEVKIEELGEEYYVVTAKDNGPGLTHDTVGKALGQLLAGTKFHRLMQMRGQQGIGASGCTMLSQMTTGKPVKVITGTGRGKPFACEVTIDPKKNQAKVENLQELDKPFRGLMVQARFKDVIYRESSTGPLEYLRRTAIANPHAQVTFISPKGEKTTFNRTANYIPKLPVAQKPHPSGATVDDIITMGKASVARKVSSFLKSDFERVGDTAIEKIQKQVKFDLNKDPKQLSWDEAEQVVTAIKQVDFIAPSTEGLRPIGEERIKKSLESIVEPEFVFTLTRPPKVYAGGYPFEVEIGIAYGGKAGAGDNGTEEPEPKKGEEENATQKVMNGENQAKVEIMRFANRAPLLFDAGNCAITEAVHTVDWKRYGIRDLENIPLTIFINFVSVHVPYTGAGKQAITDEEEIMEELRLALMQCARQTAHYINTKRHEIENKMKRDMFYKYIPEIAGALNNITKADKKMMIDKLEYLVLTKLKLEKPDIEKEKDFEKKRQQLERIKKFKAELMGGDA
ncbi:MAG: DNA topoisomerase VI subunit B [Candidatus Diapherotrites archaeon]|nr:DNA topoisomerase VI subunit B [Candidatus Diapherotrites archaeon]